MCKKEIDDDFTISVFYWVGFGEGGEAKMKGIFMEVLKCFGIKMVSFGGNMSCLFLS